MRFKKGQEIVCINDAGWYDADWLGNTDGPKYNELCVVDGFDGDSHIYLVGYNDVVVTRESFSECEFEPLISTPALYEEIEIRELELTT